MRYLNKTWYQYVGICYLPGTIYFLLRGKISCTWYEVWYHELVSSSSFVADCLSRYAKKPVPALFLRPRGSGSSSGSNKKKSIVVFGREWTVGYYTLFVVSFFCVCKIAPPLFGSWYKRTTVRYTPRMYATWYIVYMRMLCTRYHGKRYSYQHSI